MVFDQRKVLEESRGAWHTARHGGGGISQSQAGNDTIQRGINGEIARAYSER